MCSNRDSNVSRNWDLPITVFSISNAPPWTSPGNQGRQSLITKATYYTGKNTRHRESRTKRVCTSASVNYWNPIIGRCVLSRGVYLRCTRPTHLNVSLHDHIQRCGDTFTCPEQRAGSRGTRNSQDSGPEGVNDDRIQYTHYRGPYRRRHLSTMQRTEFLPSHDSTAVDFTNLFVDLIESLRLNTDGLYVPFVLNSDSSANDLLCSVYADLVLSIMGTAEF